MKLRILVSFIFTTLFLLNHTSATAANFTLDETASFSEGAGWFGFPTRTGDVNGDGYEDVVASDYQYSSNTGAVYVYFGSETGSSTNPDITITLPSLLIYNILLEDTSNLLLVSFLYSLDP